MTQSSLSGSEIDLRLLERELDRTKTHVFMGKNAAFLGPLMCYLNFVWTDQIQTAGVDGVTFYWSPKFFLALPEETRKTVLMHELWHVALLHIVRCGDRNPRVWNYACDIYINNMLEAEGYSFKGTNPWKGPHWSGQSAEQIYEELMVMALKPPPGDAWGHEGFPGHEDDEGEDDRTDLPQDRDMLPPSKEEMEKAISNVVQATHAAKMGGGGAGAIPGEVEQVLKQFLAPIIPWETVLWKFFTDLIDEDFSWMKRDRRYHDIYLPGEEEDDGLLDHLAYFLDVSGSVSDAQVIRFNSEVKYIKEVLRPKKLTLIQFDTRITQIKVFKEEDPFEELVVVGRGGTDLRPVRQWIIDNKPTASVVFSDLFVEPMQDIPDRPPIIWVAISNHSAEVPYGTLIHIKG